MGSLTSHAIHFASTIRWDDLPKAVQHPAYRCLLDTVGALIAGSQTPVAGIMRKTALQQFGGDQATIMVTGERVSAAGAALANGFFGNALDIDDGYRRVKGHPGACALPPVLAAAELAGGTSGLEFLTTLVVAYELGIRAGVIRHVTYDVYHSSGSWGAIAGAAAAGRLLGLNKKQIFHAMGAAEYHAPIAPMMKGIDTPAMGKDGIGWGCMVAVLSAIMARDGFTGVCPLFDDAPDWPWVENLGQQWEILNLYFKPYAACRWGQPAVAGALKIVREHNVKPTQIQRIRVRTFAAAARLPHGHPRDTEEAQYSLAFPVAAALLDGEVGPGQVLPPRLHDPELLAMLDRVSTEVAADFEAEFPAKALSEVIVETAAGESFRSGRIEALWEPPDTLPSDKDLEAKFLWLTGPVIGKMAAKRLMEEVWTADRWASIDPLISGKHVRVFKLKGLTIAPFICNDLWHPSLPYLGVTQKADIFVTLFNSSRGSMGNEFSNIESWNIINRFYSRVFGVYNLCANRVGCEVFEDLRSEEGEQTDSTPAAVDENPFRFWGGSEIINPFGQAIITAALFDPDAIFADISRDIVRKKRILLPYLRNDDPYFTHRELGRILYGKRNPE